MKKAGLKKTGELLIGAFSCFSEKKTKSKDENQEKPDSASPPFQRMVTVVPLFRTHPGQHPPKCSLRHRSLWQRTQTALAALSCATDERCASIVSYKV